MSVKLRSADSQYLATKLLVDENNKEFFDAWEKIEFNERMDDSVHTLREPEIGRFDQLASRFYGNPHLWWVIATANKIEDPFNDPYPGMKLRIPSRNHVLQVMENAKE